MPLEILTGPEVPALLARAQKKLGNDAVVLSVRRVTDRGRRMFELVAADAASADRQRRAERAPRGADVLVAGELPATPWRPAAGRGRLPGASLRDEPLAAPSPRALRAPVAPASRRAAPRRGFGWPFARTAPKSGRGPRVIALVGPTGAGKTTTIAKLANHPRAFADLRVGWLCLDTYRIGGVEQARQYAEISRLPFEVAWDAKDIARALPRLRDREVVLVDTPGRGPRAAADLREMQERLLGLAPDEVHLVLPAGLQKPFAHRMVTAHLPLGVTHLLPTKLDEYPDERGLFELARQFALPMRWIADGQEVPRDLQPAPETPGVSLAPLVVAEAA